jgi:L-ribulokinase
VARCNELFEHFRSLYFSLGREDSEPVSVGRLLPDLQRIASASKRDEV